MTANAWQRSAASCSTRRVTRAAEASHKAQGTLQKNAEAHTGDNIGEPVREQRDAGCQQHAAKHPNAGTKRLAQSGRGRGKCTDMDGMARRKSIEGFAGERHAMEMLPYRATVRSYLVEDRFQKVRKNGSRDRCYEDMVARARVFRA